ncbi:hypothetical protein DhcFL2_04155 [Dehalococcoides mccartyi]|nr:hypothetical protein DhcFL2_04155 [Dehalococcoides mccartyi]
MPNHEELSPNSTPGVGLCPFCGQDKISYNHRFKSWECNYCERTFPTPSYGPGGPIKTENNQLPDKQGLRICPKCWHKSLYYNPKTNLYECLNNSCKKRLTENELHNIPKTGILKRLHNRLRKPLRVSAWRIQHWLKSIFWMLVRLVLFFTVCSLITLVLVGVSDTIHTQPINFIEVLLSVIAFIGIPYTLSQTFKKRINLITSVMTVLATIILMAFSWSYLQIQSPTDVKDRIEKLFASNPEFHQTINSLVKTAELNLSEISNNIGDTFNETIDNLLNTNYVMIGNAYVVGGDGNPIILDNNPAAKDPTWDELISFLLKDNTDKQTYIPNLFVCADFAEMLHNNAEQAGIKAAYVCIELGYPSVAGHALNAFQTKDRGLVYIDCTAPIGPGPLNGDTIVILEVGRNYIPSSIFPEDYWEIDWENMGIVKVIDCVQW